MGTTPKIESKPKYNKNKPFEWVDSQWEKFMTEQKELKTKIKKLEKEITILKGTDRSDKWRIDQFNRNRAPEEQVSTMIELEERVENLFGEKINPRDTDGLEVGPWAGMEHTDEDNITWIYESPDGGKTLYRREAGNYKTKEELNTSQQLELFDD